MSETINTVPGTDTPLPDSLFAVFIPLANQTWLLPNLAVADVQTFDDVEMEPAGPAWLLGHKQWRGRRLPVISGEALCGGEVPDRTQRARLLIVNSLGGQTEAGQFVLVAQGYPQLVSVNRPAVTLAGDGVQLTSELLLSRVQLAGNTANIPDLAGIDAALQDAITQGAGAAAAAQPVL